MVRSSNVLEYEGREGQGTSNGFTGKGIGSRFILKLVDIVKLSCRLIIPYSVTLGAATQT